MHAQFFLLLCFCFYFLGIATRYQRLGGGKERRVYSGPGSTLQPFVSRASGPLCGKAGQGGSKYAVE